MPHNHEQLAETRSVPTAALYFGYGPCQFGAADENGTVPVSLIARSAEPINHWYWGSIVHDLAGMQRHKDRITLDYAHYDQEVLGFADTFEVTEAGLQVSGRLTPFGEHDRAAEVAHKAAMGVPYESSIFFADPVIEDVPSGKCTVVNGKQFAGPITVVRQCDLRGIAICPYGADKNTPVQFAAGDKVQVKVIQQKENQMSKQKTPTEEVKPVEELTPAEPVQAEAPVAVMLEATPPEATPSAAPTEPASATPLTARTGQDFLDAFGEQGAVWFVQGKTWDEAQKQFADALKAENERLKAQLAGASFGQREPVSFSPAEDDANAQHQATLSAKVGDKLARIAASLRK